MKFINMLLKGLLLGITLIYSCNIKTTLYQDLEKELDKNPNYIEYKYIGRNNQSIQIPINLDDRIQKYLHNLVNEDLEKENYCSNEESSIEITYKVTFSTENFFSVKKEVKTMFCYPYDNIYKYFINILLFENKLYKVNIKDSDYIKQIVNNYLKSEDIDVDCEYERGEYQLNLFFDKNKAYIYLVKDKVCYLKIPVEIKKDNFEFELL